MVETSSLQNMLPCGVEKAVIKMHSRPLLLRGQRKWAGKVCAGRKSQPHLTALSVMSLYLSRITTRTFQTASTRLRLVVVISDPYK